MKLRYPKLGKLMKQAREARGLTLDRAAMMLGLPSQSFLSNCEGGRNNFPPTKIQRAIEIYELKLVDVTNAMASDYAAGIREFLKK